MGCFPLVPYGNRIAHGQFRWRGTNYRLKRNFGDQPHTIHGVGWQRVWSVAKVRSDAVVLTLDHRPDETWPFAFKASVCYHLSPYALVVTIQLTSHHNAPAPAGIGLHPFFPKAHDPKLCFNASGVWQNDSRVLPLHHRGPPVEWQHHEPRRVSQSQLDNCFTGWNGVANIPCGPGSLQIEATEVFGLLQVFTPPWADFFCVEPVSHSPDSINRLDLPAHQSMQLLEPDQTLSGTIRVSLVDSGKQPSAAKAGLTG